MEKEPSYTDGHKKERRQEKVSSFASFYRLMK